MSMKKEYLRGMNKTIKRFGLCAVLCVGLLGGLRGQMAKIYKVRVVESSGGGFTDRKGNSYRVWGLTTPANATQDDIAFMKEEGWEICWSEIKLARKRDKVLWDLVSKNPVVEVVGCLDFTGGGTYFCWDIRTANDVSIRWKLLEWGYAKHRKGKDWLYNYIQGKDFWCRIAKAYGY